jgi:hypothetical protein
MSRYVNCYLVTKTVEGLTVQFEKILKSCDFDIVYQSSECIVAREIPGKVPFSKLVTVELLIDNTKATAEQIQVDLIAKSDELTLQLDNHCYRLFDNLTKTIANCGNWQILEGLTS